ncbi:MAG: hypothetical protein R3F30_03420 [Planctomycetota bacterium]
MDGFERPRMQPREQDRGGRLFPIALTLAILAVGVVGIIRFTAEEERAAPPPPVRFEPGSWPYPTDLYLWPLGREDEACLVRYRFEYAAVPSYADEETIRKRLSVFERDARSFFAPMSRAQMARPQMRDMIRTGLMEVLERSLFPPAQGRVTDFTIDEFVVP